MLTNGWRKCAMAQNKVFGIAFHSPSDFMDLLPDNLTIYYGDSASADVNVKNGYGEKNSGKFNFVFDSVNALLSAGVEILDLDLKMNRKGLTSDEVRKVIYG